MYRDAYKRPLKFERVERFRIPQDDGRAVALEAIGLLSVIAVLAVLAGFAVGVPLAMMLNDVCANLKC